MARQRSAPASARPASSTAAAPAPAAAAPTAAPAAAPTHAAPVHTSPQPVAPQAQPASSSWFGFSKPAAPAPVAAAPAPPPALSSGSSGGGVMSGIMGSVVTGAAMGTGSAIASRAIDSFMGPREVKVVHENVPAAAAPAPAAPMAASPMTDDGPCGQRMKEFAECMSRNNGDMGSCTFYFDSMQACKTQHRL